MAQLSVREVDVKGKVRWAFLVDGEFATEEFHPEWGLTTYHSAEGALEAGQFYLKTKGLPNDDS